MKKKLGLSAYEQNNQIATENRQFLYGKGIFAINIIGSPGCGKTSILEYTAGNFKKPFGVIIGDVKTALDSNRVIKAGNNFSYAIETGGGCHISPLQLKEKLNEINTDIDYLFVENVGNLVCPSSFDLGESFKVAVLSIPEGDEKVRKYPSLFLKAEAVIINKIDLLDYMDYDIDQVVKDCKTHNPKAEIFKTSIKTGEGFSEWFEFLTEKRKHF
ncbi:MAG: hydrogenase nickel incorporation protein HypB [Acidobacteriota bacterium]